MEEINQMVEEGKVDLTPRTEIPELPEEERIRDFREVELVLTEEQAKREAARCLACGICSECHLCVQVCKREAIDHQQAPCGRGSRSRIRHPLTRLLPLRAELSPELGYGRYPNVVTSMEFERMLSASGPWGGHVTRRSSDHREPKKIAFLQCVGSREHEGACLLSARLLHVCDQRGRCSRWSIFKGPWRPQIFHIDMRAFGKDLMLLEPGEGKGNSVLSIADFWILPVKI